MTGRVRRFAGSERGVSAVEFALIAPFLVFALLAMVDVAFAVNERMEIERLLRGGAQHAMSDPGEANVRTVIEASAESGFAAGSAFTLTVQRYCACPSDSDTAVTCSASCPDSDVTAIYYRMDGARTHTGLILPDIDLDAVARVRVR